MKIEMTLTALFRNMAEEEIFVINVKVLSGQLVCGEKQGEDDRVRLILS
jgi:hypothetical protein